MNPRSVLIGTCVCVIAAVAFIAGCSKAPSRIDIHIGVIEADVNRMKREMQVLNAEVGSNTVSVFFISNRLHNIEKELEVLKADVDDPKAKLHKLTSQAN